MKSNERRRAERFPVLESFSLFIVIPDVGDFRLKVHDLSNEGIAFDLDFESELQLSKKYPPGQKLKIHFFLNASLFIPVDVEVKRQFEHKPVNSESTKAIGAVFCERSSGGYIALQSFLAMLEGLVGHARTDLKSREASL